MCHQDHQGPGPHLFAAHAPAPGAGHLLSAATAGAVSGLLTDADHVDDVRLAVQQLCTVLSQAATQDAQLHLTVKIAAHAVHVIGTTTVHRPPALSEVGAILLHALCTDHELTVAADSARFHACISARHQ